MAETEELRILLRTVANTQGATQARDALRGVRSAAADATQTTAGMASGFRVGAGDILRFAGALTGLSIGLSLFTSAGQAIADSIDGASTSLIESQRVARATAAAYGTEASAFTRFATELSTATGFTSNAILQAALSARTLSENYGLSIQQTQNLIRVSADLAQIRGIGVAEAFDRVQSAIRGEAEASEFLGLTLNATFLKNNALGGSLKNTFETLTDGQKAQVVYTELLRQSAEFQGLAAQGAGGLEGAQRQANLAASDFSRTLGEVLAPALIDLQNRQAAASRGAQELAQNLGRGVLQENRAAQALANRDEIGKLLEQIGITQTKWGLLTDTSTKSLLNVEELADRLGVSWDELLAVMEASQDKFSGSAEGLELVRKVIERVNAASAAAVPQVEKFTETWRTINATLVNTHDSFATIARDISEMSAASSTLGTILAALGTTNPGLTAELTTLQDIIKVNESIRAQAAAQAAARGRVLDKEATKITDPRDAVGSQALRERVRLTDQLLPLELAVAEAKRQQSEFADAVAANQAAENAVILSILPQRQEIARLEWEMANAVDRRVQLRQEETRLLAQQRALQPNNALEDTQATIRRNELLLGIRGQDPAVKRAARLENRNLERFVVPGQELAAFDANQVVIQAQRAENATNLAEQIRQNPLKAQIEGLRLNALSGERTAFALDQNSQVLDLAGKSFTSNTDKMTKALDDFVKKAGEPRKIELTVHITEPSGNTVTVHELIEAIDRAIIPPAVPQSGVRRPF